MNVLSFRTIPKTIRALIFTKFDNVIREFFPLKRVVIVDINLPEQFNEILHQSHLIFSLWQVMKHDFNELGQGKPLLFILHEIFLYLL